MSKSAKKPFYKDLFLQVAIAAALGILAGHFFPLEAASLKPLGDAFIALIRMMIGPIIFCTIVGGIAGMDSLKHAGRVGIKALVYFEILTMLVLVMGAVTAHLFLSHPNIALIKTAMHPEVLPAAGEVHTTLIEFIMNIIPHTFFSAFTDGQILQVVLTALLFSAGLTMMNGSGGKIVRAVGLFSNTVFNIIGLIVKLAPIGVFGAMAYSVSKFGVASLQNLGLLIAVFFSACIVFVILVLGATMQFYCKLSLWQFIRYLAEEIMICFGTASSETVLPRLMDKLMALGCPKEVVGMVVPTGYSFNLTGTGLYLALAAIFSAYATGVDLTLGQEATILGLLMITSKGTAAVYGTAFIILSGTLNAMKIFPEDKLAVVLALLFSIDRIMAPGRVITNLIGNGVATLLIAKWEGMLDYGTARAVLSGKKEAELMEEV